MFKIIRLVLSAAFAVFVVINASIFFVVFFFGSLMLHGKDQNGKPLECDPWPTAPWTMLFPGVPAGCAAAIAISRPWGAK